MGTRWNRLARGGSNWYPIACFEQKFEKISEFFYLKIFSFLEVKFSIDLNRRVFLINYTIRAATWENAPSEFVSIEGSNQPAHRSSLIRIFTVRMKKLCILGYPKWAQWRFWSDCTNAQADLNHVWCTCPKVRFLLLQLITLTHLCTMRAS